MWRFRFWGRGAYTTYRALFILGGGSDGATQHFGTELTPKNRGRLSDGRPGEQSSRSKNDSLG